MRNKKKVNPRRVSRSAEEQRWREKLIKDKATDEAMRTVLYMLLYVLVDKHSATKEEIAVIQDELNYVADSVSKGYIQWSDIKKMLEEEYDVHLTLM